jgi:pilus assembly protein TadC
MSRMAGKPVSAGGRRLGYLMVILFALMLLVLVCFGCKFLFLALFKANLSARVRVLLMAAGVFALYTPARVGLGMMQRRRERT